MDPFTAAMVAAGTMKAVGSLVEGQSQAKAYKAEARMADANAQMTYDQTNQREEQVRRESRAALSDQAAAVAQSGTGFTGSNLDVMKQSAANAELDALNTRYQGSVTAVSYKNKAAGLRRAASDSLRAGWLGAGTAALSTVASYGSASGGGGGGGASASAG